jgi:hypothetical protein
VVAAGPFSATVGCIVAPVGWADARQDPFILAAAAIASDGTPGSAAPGTAADPDAAGIGTTTEAGASLMPLPPARTDVVVAPSCRPGPIAGTASVTPAADAGGVPAAPIAMTPEAAEKPARLIAEDTAPADGGATVGAATDGAEAAIGRAGATEAPSPEPAIPAVTDDTAPASPPSGIAELGRRGVCPERAPAKATSTAVTVAGASPAGGTTARGPAAEPRSAAMAGFGVVLAARCAAPALTVTAAVGTALRLCDAGAAAVAVTGGSATFADGGPPLMGRGAGRGRDGAPAIPALKDAAGLAARSARSAVARRVGAAAVPVGGSPVVATLAP